MLNIFIKHVILKGVPLTNKSEKVKIYIRIY